MTRTIVRIHTAILGLAAVAILVAPGVILAAFNVEAPSFPVLALIRILAGFILVLAVAVMPVPDLPIPARGHALTLIALAYCLLAALCIVQQVAIWSNMAGALLTAELILHAAAFVWLAIAERGSSAVSV